MILVTTDFISGKEIETIALVKGSTVQCKNVGKDIMSGFKCFAYAAKEVNWNKGNVYRPFQLCF